MLYTEDFTMRHYVGFSQIGSHMLTIFGYEVTQPIIKSAKTMHIQADTFICVKSSIKKIYLPLEKL